jgi:hypothetical protein
LDTKRLNLIFGRLQARIEQDWMDAETINQIFELLQQLALSSGLPPLSELNAAQCTALAQSEEARKAWLGRIHQGWLKTISSRRLARCFEAESSDIEEDSDEAEYSDVVSDVE